MRHLSRTFGLAGLGLLVGCTASPSPTELDSPRVVATSTASPVPTTSPQPVPIISPEPVATMSPSPTLTILTNGGAPNQLPAATYRIDLSSLSSSASIYPTFRITLPERWVSFSGWVINRPVSGHEVPPVAIQFWDVTEIYAHPCQWEGSLFDPGPGVDDLAHALTDIPLRNATEPVNVTIGGFQGKFVEWSVPSDMRAVGDSFLDCDESEDVPGLYDFQSWKGRGWATDRYHQGPGQIDLLWILDLHGSRLVIDAFQMPYSTQAERDELIQIVELIEFEEADP